MLSELMGHFKWLSILIILNVWFTLVDQDRTLIMPEVQQGQQAVKETTALQQERKAAADAAVAKPVLPQEQQVNYKYVPKLGEDLSKYTAIEVVATGYYAGRESTGKDPDHPEYGITFSGVRVVRNDKAFSTIAADTNIFPLGTVLFIPGYGYGVVADTGSAIKGKKIDLYFDTKDQVYQEWGKKKVNVFVVKKGSGKVTDVIWKQLHNEILS